MIKIYHNSRCQKSREGLAILQKSGYDFEVVNYLENIPTKEELRSLLTCLEISAENLVRKSEAVWKENYRGKVLSEEDILDAMMLHPKLIERPIVINGNRAVIGRPPKNIEEIL
jgi:arsenate reductase